MLRSTILAVLAFGLSQDIRANLLTTTYLYRFTLPTLDRNGSPNGGSFTNTFSFSRGPLRNTVQNPVSLTLGYVDVTQSPEPGFTFSGADFANIDPLHGYTLLGGNYNTEAQGALLELYYSSSNGVIGFGFAAPDSFWSGPGGVFGADPTLGNSAGTFAVYLAASDPACIACSVNITPTPEPGSLALMATAAVLSLIAFRRRKKTPPQ